MKLKIRSMLPLMLASLLLSGCSQKNPEEMLSSAKSYLLKKNNKAAIIEIKNGLQAQPDLPEAHYLLGVALLNDQDPSNAEVELRKAMAFGYSKDLVLPKLAAALNAGNQGRKLVEEFSAARLGSSNAISDFQIELAFAYASMGKLQQANDAMNASLAANPSNVAASLAKAWQVAVAKNFEGALAQVDKVLARVPDSAEALKMRGDLFLFLKDDQAQAMIDYRKAVAARGDFLPAHLSILGLLVQQEKVADAQQELKNIKAISPNAFAVRYAEASVAYIAKDYKRAQALTSQLLKVAPDQPGLLTLAGRLELESNNLQQAETYLARSLQLSPKSVLAKRFLVVTYLRAGQPQKALDTLRGGQPDAEIPPALYSLAGEVFLESGDTKSAEAFFTKATELDPQSANTRTSLAMTKMIRGDTEAAFGELRDIASTDKGVAADMALINAYFERAQYDKALVAIDGLEHKLPGSPVASTLRGRADLGQHNAAAARASFEKALAIAPTYFPAAANLVAMDLSDNRPAEARQRMERILAKDPKNEAALMALAELTARAGGGTAEVAKLLADAVEASPTSGAPRALLVDLYLGAHDLKAAVVASENAAAALPDNPQVLDALGRVQQATGQFNQAISTFTRVIELAPRSTKPVLGLADAYAASGDDESADRTLRKALVSQPDAVELLQRLVSLDLKRSKFQDAQAIARGLQAKRPQDPAGFVLGGDVASVQKDWVSAAKSYEVALKLRPTTALAIRLASTLRAGGKGSDADRSAQAWLKDRPDDAKFLFYLGEEAIRAKDYARAENNYLSVVKLEPNNAAALNNLGWVSARLGKPAALDYTNRALALAPNEPAYQDTKAMMLADAGDFAAAVELEKNALAKRPDDGLLRLNLAKIYIKAGNKPSAKAELDVLARLGDGFAGKAEVADLRRSL